MKCMRKNRVWFMLLVNDIIKKILLIKKYKIKEKIILIKEFVLKYL